MFAYRAVLFDFDGTLAVQTLDFARMRERAVAAISPYARPGLRPNIPLMEELSRLLAELPAPEAERARKAALDAAGEVEMEAARTSRLFPATRPVLAALKRVGAVCAVVTRNCPQAVLTVFPDLAEHCRVLLTRDDVPLVKPHPDHLLRALDRLQVAPGAALMVGDHPMDIQAGKAAGTATAGLAGGNTPRSRLAEEKPDHLASTADELFRSLGLDIPEF